MRNVEKEVAELRDGADYRDVWSGAAKEMNLISWAKLPPITLSTDYLKQAGRVSRLRVIAAGVRLGVMLGDKPAITQDDTAAE